MNLKISAERGDGMLNYLAQGMILYVMAAVCVIGVISRFAANRCYKSLIRQSDNLAAAKDKQLQQMKTKYESIYRMNCGMKNTEAFVSKMQQQYRIAGTRLTSWENCSINCAAAAFLIGAVSSLILYLNKGSVQNCVLYLAGGSLMAAGMIVLSGLMGNSSNKDLLETALVHYFENVLVVRSARDMPDGISEEQVNRPELVRKEEPEKDHQKQLEELKESLAQIAAARGESGDRQVHKQQTRKLSPKEEQLINDIISQYLS